MRQNAKRFYHIIAPNIDSKGSNIWFYYDLQFDFFRYELFVYVFEFMY